MMNTNAMNTLALRDSDIQAVRTIGARDIWGIDELPESLDPTTLLELDRRGLVEVRMVVVKNTQEHPDDPPTQLIQRHAWFSPFMEPWKAGEWGGHSLTDRRRDMWHHPCELRLTRQGRDELYREVKNSQSDTLDTCYLPASEFPVQMHARLRMAARPGRKTKRVRSVKRDGVNLYSLADAYHWWPGELDYIVSSLRNGA